MLRSRPTLSPIFNSSVESPKIDRIAERLTFRMLLQPKVFAELQIKSGKA